MRWIVFAAAIILSGCGYIGPIQPPALDIPQQPPDLRVVEYGAKLVVEFTLPNQTTEGLSLRSIRSLEVRVGPSIDPFAINRWADQAKPYAVTATKPGPFMREIPASDWSGKEVLVSVRAVGPKGKAAAWTTPKIIMVEPPLARPASLVAENVEQGVKLKWKGATAKYRIFRSIADAAPERLNDSDRPEYVDDSTVYGTTYHYLVQGLSDELHQSEVSDSATVTPEDKFPPAVPAALTAIQGVSTIELAWTRNTEPDFQGYNIYRSIDNGPFEKIASMITSPTYSDTKIEAGKKYRYAVTSVDKTGNESARSTVAEASAQ
jgi:hypothetical protein